MITVSEVIKVSSNIGAAKLAFDLGAERTLGYLKDFGFSRPTNLGLSGEASGRMQRAETIKPIELATTSYGHGVNSTTLQLAAAVATLANEGVRMEPHLVSKFATHRAAIRSLSLRRTGAWFHARPQRRPSR